jgi:homopolymeric O-antigen transport system permease protein
MIRRQKSEVGRQKGPSARAKPIINQLMDTPAISRAGSLPLVDRSAQIRTIRATVASVVHYRQLIRSLVAKDLKLKYRGSVLGFLWSLVSPLLMLGVYTLAFKYIMHVTTEGFVFLLLVGILAWNFFVGSLVMSTGAIVDNAGLLKSVLFPRAVLPIASVMFNFAQYVLTAGVLIPVMLVIYRVPATPILVLYPFFLFLQLVFITGLALALSAAAAHLRDTRHLLDIALQALFWTTPIVLPLAMVQGKWWRPLVMLSPMSPFVVAYQRVLYYGMWPGTRLTAVAIVYALVALAIGTAIFLRSDRRFSELV